MFLYQDGFIKSISMSHLTKAPFFQHRKFHHRMRDFFIEFFSWAIALTIFIFITWLLVKI